MQNLSNNANNNISNNNSSESKNNSPPTIRLNYNSDFYIPKETKLQWDFDKLNRFWSSVATYQPGEPPPRFNYKTGELGKDLRPDGIKRRIQRRRERAFTPNLFISAGIMTMDLRSNLDPKLPSLRFMEQCFLTAIDHLKFLYRGSVCDASNQATYQSNPLVYKELTNIMYALKEITAENPLNSYSDTWGIKTLDNFLTSEPVWPQDAFPTMNIEEKCLVPNETCTLEDELLSIEAAQSALSVVRLIKILATYPEGNEYAEIAGNLLPKLPSWIMRAKAIKKNYYLKSETKNQIFCERWGNLIYNAEKLIAWLQPENIINFFKSVDENWPINKRPIFHQETYMLQPANLCYINDDDHKSLKAAYSALNELKLLKILATYNKCYFEIVAQLKPILTNWLLGIQQIIKHYADNLTSLGRINKNSHRSVDEKLHQLNMKERWENLLVKAQREMQNSKHNDKEKDEFLHIKEKLKKHFILNKVPRECTFVLMNNEGEDEEHKPKKLEKRRSQAILKCQIAAEQDPHHQDLKLKLTERRDCIEDEDIFLEMESEPSPTLPIKELIKTDLVPDLKHKRNPSPTLPVKELTTADIKATPKKQSLLTAIKKHVEEKRRRRQSTDGIWDAQGWKDQESQLLEERKLLKKAYSQPDVSVKEFYNCFESMAAKLPQKNSWKAHAEKTIKTSCGTFILSNPNEDEGSGWSE